eukprot:jgi/Mesen1/8305/ME000455S07465
MRPSPPPPRPGWPSLPATSLGPRPATTQVVFATETLAAGINMPARTTVLSTLSKRGDSGHALLSANALLQMAGRAGRRGKDRQGHVVIVQTPFEGAPEAVGLLLGGPDALVSQFTATYGMALNLLAGSTAQQRRIQENIEKKEEEEERRRAEAEASGGASEAGTEEEGGREREKESEEKAKKAAVRGRSMEEARALVERSFGNYLGNE